MHRTTKLSITIAAGGIFVVDSEDAGFVAIQCQWFAMLFQITPGSFKIGEGRFRFHKSKLHQPTRRIVDIDQYSTGRCTVLKPVVFTTINLYQFTTACPARAWLLNFWRTLFMRHPESGFYHEPSEGFLAKDDTVIFCQLFLSQCRTKV